MSYLIIADHPAARKLCPKCKQRELTVLKHLSDQNEKGARSADWLMICSGGGSGDCDYMLQFFFFGKRVRLPDNPPLGAA